MVAVTLLQRALARAASIVVMLSPLSDVTQQQLQLTDKDNQMVQMAFRDFDLKRLDDSDKEFTAAIKRWKNLHRPRDEVVSLLKAR